MIFVLTLMTIARNLVLVLSSMRPRRDGRIARFMRALHKSRRISAERQIARYRYLIESERELRELRSTLAHHQRPPALAHDTSIETQTLRLIKL